MLRGLPEGRTVHHPRGLLRHTGPRAPRSPRPPNSHTPVLAELCPSGRHPALRGPLSTAHRRTPAPVQVGRAVPTPGSRHRTPRGQGHRPPARPTLRPPPALGLRGHVEAVRRERGAWPVHARARPLCQAYSLDPASPPTRETHTPSSRPAGTSQGGHPAAQLRPQLPSAPPQLALQPPALSPLPQRGQDVAWSYHRASWGTQTHTRTHIRTAHHTPGEYRACSGRTSCWVQPVSVAPSGSDPKGRQALERKPSAAPPEMAE